MNPHFFVYLLNQMIFIKKIHKNQVFSDLQVDITLLGSVQHIEHNEDSD